MAITRESQLAELEGMGITGKAAECLLRECVAERHMSRVVDAKCAAVGEIRLIYTQPTVDELLGGSVEDFVAAQAAGLCLLDQIGVGGTDGVSGAGTARIPCFSNLGKGRKQASDGGAWDGAIEGAQRELAEDAGYSSRVLTICPILPNDGLWGKDDQWGRRECGIGVVLPNNDPWKDGRPDFTVIPALSQSEDVTGRAWYDYSWHWSLARECLRRTAGKKPWHPDVYMEIIGTPAEWAAVVNHIDYIRSLEKLEHDLISYWWNHQDDPEGHIVETHDVGREVWVKAKVTCERSTLPKSGTITVVGVDHADIVPTLTIFYKSAHNHENEWWDLRENQPYAEGSA